MIRTEGLTKRFGGLVAVDGLDLDVREGDLFGFLGPNGSGKTTTVRMLLGLVFATSGRIEVLGRPMPKAAREVLPQVGSLVEGPAFYPHLSGRANLTLFDAAGPAQPRPLGPGPRRRRVDEALARVGLDRVGRRPVKAWSTGMRQRLGLAAALLRAPRLLVLDEPTNGLDPHGMREVRDLLVELVAGGTTVFLSSHLLAEIELVCTRAAIVDRGRLVAQDRVEALLGPTGRVLVTTPDVGAAADLAAALPGGAAGGAPARPPGRPPRRHRPRGAQPAAGRRRRPGPRAGRRAPQPRRRLPAPHRRPRRTPAAPRPAVPRPPARPRRGAACSGLSCASWSAGRGPG